MKVDQCTFSTRLCLCSKNGVSTWPPDPLPPLTEGAFIPERLVSFSACPLPRSSSAAALSVLPALPDGALDTALRADEAGSEEDVYEDVHSSSHHYSHPGGGGEQLAINEVGSGLHG